MDLLHRLPRDLLESVVPYLAATEPFESWERRFIDWYYERRCCLVKDAGPVPASWQIGDRHLWHVCIHTALQMFMYAQPTVMPFAVFERFTGDKLDTIMQYIRALNGRHNTLNPDNVVQLPPAPADDEEEYDMEEEDEDEDYEP